jgi:hypothetical protein
MKNKQTAVDWLIQELIELDKQLDGRRKNKDATVFKLPPDEIYKRAKQMMKYQLKDAHYDGQLTTSDCGADEEFSEEYYNETYGKQNIS